MKNNMNRQILVKKGTRITDKRIEKDRLDTTRAFGEEYTTLQYLEEVSMRELKKVNIFSEPVETKEEVALDLGIETKPTNTIVNCFNPDHLKVLESAIKLDRHVLLVGHTGLGKTTLVQELANENSKTLIRISVHSGVTADEIIGKWLAVNGTTIWQDGILTTAMRKGDWVVFDEINACPADVMFALHSLLDDAKQITLLEKDSEIVKPHAEFRFFATMNPVDDYAGTKEMNMAFMSRFNAVIEITGFAPDVEESILVSKGIDKVTANKLVGYASKLREKKAKDEILFYCGTRDIINAGLLVSTGLSIELACSFAITNKMNSEDREQVKSILPNVQYETPEAKALKEAEKNNKTLQDTIIVLDKTITELKAEVKKLESNSGNTNLDENTQKALRILKVLK